MQTTGSIRLSSKQSALADLAQAEVNNRRRRRSPRFLPPLSHRLALLQHLRPLLQLVLQVPVVAPVVLLIPHLKFILVAKQPPITDTNGQRNGGPKAKLQAPAVLVSGRTTGRAAHLSEATPGSVGRQPDSASKAAFPTDLALNLKNIYDHSFPCIIT